MSREDIISMAKEAGLVNWEATAYANELERFAALVASAERESLRESFRVVTAAEASAAILHEREACAKVCETLGVHPALNVWNGGPDWYKHGKDCAEAIRARGQA